MQIVVMRGLLEHENVSATSKYSLVSPFFICY